MSHFKILIQHYLRCLLRIAVTSSSALTRLSDHTPLLRVMYECMKETYFSLPRHCPQRQLLRRIYELSPWNNWPLSWAEDRGEGRKRRGKGKHSNVPGY